MGGVLVLLVGANEQLHNSVVIPPTGPEAVVWNRAVYTRHHGMETPAGYVGVYRQAFAVWLSSGPEAT